MPHKAADIPSLYTPVERKLLARYLRIADPRPADLSRIRLTARDPETWNEREDGVAPLSSPLGNDGLMIEDAVARLCLQSRQARLPQWAAVSSQAVTLGRRGQTRAQNRRRLRPRHLFTINWADSGPGFSWPEAYYVTTLPGYNVAIVTGSNDSPDALGYCDFAIGSFVPAKNQVDQIRRGVTHWWRRRRRDGQGRWDYMLEPGLIDAETADAWAREVWCDSEAADITE